MTVCVWCAGEWKDKADHKNCEHAHDLGRREARGLPGRGEGVAEIECLDCGTLNYQAEVRRNLAGHALHLPEGWRWCRVKHHVVSGGKTSTFYHYQPVCSDCIPSARQDHLL